MSLRTKGGAFANGGYRLRDSRGKCYIGRFGSPPPPMTVRVWRVSGAGGERCVVESGVVHARKRKLEAVDASASQRIEEVPVGIVDGKSDDHGFSFLGMWSAWQDCMALYVEGFSLPRTLCGFHSTTAAKAAQILACRPHLQSCGRVLVHTPLPLEKANILLRSMNAWRFDPDG